MPNINALNSCAPKQPRRKSPPDRRRAPYRHPAKHHISWYPQPYPQGTPGIGWEKETRISQNHGIRADAPVRTTAHSAHVAAKLANIGVFFAALKGSRQKSAETTTP
ncbi:MAG: hypothetical protein QNK42_18165, partial [Pseudodonghicola sp.]|nr:hypothetical protein [Pseudodonghicola sp.]